MRTADLAVTAGGETRYGEDLAPIAALKWGPTADPNGIVEAWPRDPDQYRRDAVRDKTRYPLYGDFSSNITPCAFWNKPAEPVTTVDNNVGLLTVQNQVLEAAARWRQDRHRKRHPRLDALTTADFAAPLALARR